MPITSKNYDSERVEVLLCEDRKREMYKISRVLTVRILVILILAVFMTFFALNRFTSEDSVFSCRVDAQGRVWHRDKVLSPPDLRDQVIKMTNMYGTASSTIVLTLDDQADLKAFMDTLQLIWMEHALPRVPIDQTKASAFVVLKKETNQETRPISPITGPLTAEQHSVEGLVPYEELESICRRWNAQEVIPSFFFFIERHSAADIKRSLNAAYRAGCHEIILNIQSGETIISDIIQDMLSPEPNPNIKYSKIIFPSTPELQKDEGDPDVTQKRKKDSP
jgi:hypothetical protein